MNSKEDLNLDLSVTSLLDDLQRLVIEYVPTETLQSWKTQGQLGFFKSELDIRILLNHVVCGEYDSVQQILDQDISSITKKGRVTDRSGRSFENISAFEYALWALDEHMWTRMLDCLKTMNNETRISVLATMIEQYHSVKDKGITYTWNGKRITENHYNFAIIPALKNLVASLQKPNTSSKSLLEVGRVQKLFPVHVAHEYCDQGRRDDDYGRPDMSWNKHSRFSTRPEQLSLKYCYKGDEKDWFSQDGTPDEDFAIFKDEVFGGSGTIDTSKDETPATKALLEALCTSDLEAMEILYKTRIESFIRLSNSLEEENQAARTISNSGALMQMPI